MKINKIVLTVASLGLVATLFTGCSFNQFETPQEYIAKGQDKHLTTSFAPKYWDKSRIYQDGITLREEIITFSDQIKQYQAEDRVGQLFDENEFVKIYKDAILKRGNSYKVYKNRLTEEIIKAAFNVQNLRKASQDRYHRYDWTPSIIEYDKNGNIVSALVQYHDIFVSLNHFSNNYAPVSVETETYVFTGYKAKSLKNKISNRWFEDYLLYESK